MQSISTYYDVIVGIINRFIDDILCTQLNDILMDILRNNYNSAVYM